MTNDKFAGTFGNFVGFRASDNMIKQIKKVVDTTFTDEGEKKYLGISHFIRCSVLVLIRYEKNNDMVKTAEDEL